MLTASIIKALQVYGIAIAISMLVAVLIKLMVAATARLEQTRPNGVPIGTVCPIEQGIPDEDVAALSAAILPPSGRITYCTSLPPAMAGRVAHAPASIPIHHDPGKFRSRK